MVPRTFIGPLAVSAVANPVVTALKVAGTSKLWAQIVGIYNSLIFKVGTSLKIEKTNVNFQDYQH